MLLKKNKLLSALYFSCVSVASAVTVRSAQNPVRRFVRRQVAAPEHGGLKSFIKNLFPDIVKVTSSFKMFL